MLVIDTESRHLSADEAYEIIHSLTLQALEAGIRKIYKKTDSGLRGNVGAELKAVLDATGAERLEFVPAWPKMHRTTRDGIHYVNGLPLSESIFSKDVIDPVTESHIDALIHQQADVKVTLHGQSEKEEGIVVYDCTDDQQLEAISRCLAETERELFVYAGCSGLLEKMPRVSEKKKRAHRTVRLPQKLMVLSGSMNEITARQLQSAQDGGSNRVHAPMDKIAAGTWCEREIEEFCSDFLRKAGTPVAIIDTMGEIGSCSLNGSDLARQIADYMGRISGELLKEDMDRTLMIIGGDTLQGFIRELGITSLQPVREIASGIVLAKYSYRRKVHYLITKSGGFGTDNQLIEIQQGL